MNNVQKTFKNSVISVFAQVCTLFLQFVNRRVFIVFLDIEYLGYQSLFSNVFSLLSVAELGIGNIIAFHLYKEITNRNNEEIGRLMYLYKWMYRIVACVVLVAGLICFFLLPFFVKDAKESWDYLHLVYFLQLAGVILGYFLSYKRTLFIATQQEYKCHRIDLIVLLFVQVVQLGLLAIFRNYILYLAIQLSTSLIANIVISIKYDRDFPYLKKKYTVSKDYLRSRNIIADMRDIVVHKISNAIYAGTDNVIISAFCGIRYVALYGNYTLVQKGVMQVLFYRLLNPIQATIGNIVYGGRNKQELWEQFQVLDVFSFFFGSYIGIGFFVFFQPFIQLWMGKEYLLPDLFVILFSITIYLGAVWEVVNKYRNVFGDYKQDRNVMLLSAILNILISILGAKLWGIVGIQLGTLIAYLPISYGRIRFVVKNFFGQSMWKYYFKHFVLLLLSLSEALICYLICKHFPVSVLGLIERGVIWLCVPLIANTSIFRKDKYFIGMCKYLKEIGIIAIGKIKQKKGSI